VKLHGIVCQVISRECYHSAAHSSHLVSLSVLNAGLHSVPDNLRQTLQNEIDKASAVGNDYIVLGYGLCSRGTADLIARDTPIVIPRMHDCITLLLGSKERYDEEFRGNPGTYYFSSGWIERMDADAGQGGFESIKDKASEARLKEYIEKYGEDNALFLLEQEQSWMNNYSRAALIDLPLGDVEAYRKFTSQLAVTRGWSYAAIEGDMRLSDRLFSGEWDSSEFLIVQPGQRTIEAINDGIISVCQEHLT